MNEMYYSVRDPWGAPRLGTSGKKIWLALKSIVYGFAAYLLLAYGAHMITGASPATVWQVFHLFPQVPSIERGLIPVLLWNIGVFAALLIVLVGATGIAKMTYRQLKGDEFYGASDAWKFALDHGRSSVSTPLILVVLFGIVSLSLWILGWVSKIPGAGPILLGISAIPAVVVAVVGVYLLIALMLSLVYTPAIIGTTGEDGLEGVIQIFSLLWSQPWRTVGYSAVVVFTTVIATYVLSVVVLGGFALAGSIIGDVYGVDFANIAAGVRMYLPPEGSLLSALPDWIWPGPVVASLPVQRFGLDFAGSPSGVESVAAFLGGLSLLLFIGMIAAYWVSSLTSGMTASYLVLRRIKDGEVLLEWIDDVDELEELAATDVAAAETPGESIEE